MDDSSDFTPFNLDLTNGATLSGIQYWPAPSLSTPDPEPNTFKPKPLLILLHGGGCNAHYFDLDRDHSISVSAKAHSLPVISINRPCYGTSTSLLPLPEKTTFHQETGRWLHEYILPALWRTFGETHHCTSLVVIGHSLATPGIIVSAALHAREAAPTYPLAAIVFSGWGLTANRTSQNQRLAWTPEEMVANRSLLMLSSPALQLADHGLIKQHQTKQSFCPPREEAVEVVSGPWNTYWRPYARDVAVPVLYAVGEHDWLWEVSEDDVRSLGSCFESTPRFEGGIVLAAPHAIEWSFGGLGWLARCVGFAIEGAAWLENRERRGEA